MSKSESKYNGEEKGSDKSYDRSEKKGDDKEDADSLDGNDEPTTFDVPTFDAISIKIDPETSSISSELYLKITFSLDKDVVAAYWEIKVTLSIQ